MGTHRGLSNQSWWVGVVITDSLENTPIPCSRPAPPLMILPFIFPTGLCSLNHFLSFSLSMDSFPSIYNHAQISPIWKKKKLKLSVHPEFPSNYLSFLSLFWQLPKRKVTVIFFYNLTFHSLWHLLQFCFSHDIFLQYPWSGFHLDGFLFHLSYRTSLLYLPLLGIYSSLILLTSSFSPLINLIPPSFFSDIFLGFCYCLTALISPHILLSNLIWSYGLSNHL